MFRRPFASPDVSHANGARDALPAVPAAPPAPGAPAAAESVIAGAAGAALANGAPRSRLTTFRALRHRNFALLWVGMIVSSVGTWMQIVAQSLLVLSLTNGSAFALGVVSLAQAVAFFSFALIGGGVADRVDKRRLLLFTQTCSMLLAALLGALTAFGVIQVWMIVGVAFVSGCVLSFDQPSRSALIPLLVPREELLNALSLQSIIFTAAGVVGPALAAFTLVQIGYAGNFFLNSVSFLAVLGVLLVLRVPQAAAGEARESRGNLLANVADALRLIRQDSVLPWLVTNYGAMLFLGPSSSLILPIFATQVLHVGKVGLGILFSASGIGSVLGGLLVASFPNIRRKGLLALTGSAIWAAAFVGFAVSRNIGISLLLLALAGAAQSICTATTITLMQLRVPPRMRGRVMSLNTLILMGLRPLGDFPAGALIGPLGAPVIVGVSVSLVGLYTIGVGSTRRSLREV